MTLPDDAPSECPVCAVAYDSVSEHDAGVMVNLLENERYRRVCFEPRPEGSLRFFHHTHAQTADDDHDRRGERDGDLVENSRDATAGDDAPADSPSPTRSG